MAITGVTVSAPALGERIAGYFAMPRDGAAIAELDGLRALAILLVLLRHGVRPFWSLDAPLLPIGPWDLAIPMMNGWAGVDLFFVLSGFLITHHILGRYRRYDGRIAFGGYIARRALRILPAYYVMLLILVAGLLPYYEVPSEDLAFRLGYHLLFLQDYLPQTIAPVFWSLGVEEKFYLVAPLVLLLVLRAERRRTQYILVGGLVALPCVFRVLTLLQHPDPIEYAEYFMRFRSPFHLSFDGLAVGMLCALLYRDRGMLAWTKSRPVASVLFWIGAVSIAALLAAGPLLDRVDGFDEILLQTVLAAGFGLMLLGLCLGGGPSAWFRAGWMLIVARLAYALYLVHYPLVAGVTGVLGETSWYPALPPVSQFLTFLPFYLAASLTAATLLHYAVEKPFLLLRERPATPVLHPLEQSRR